MNDLFQLLESAGDFLEYTPDDLLAGDALDCFSNLLEDADFTTFTPDFLQDIASLSTDSIDLVSSLGDETLGFDLSGLPEAEFLGQPEVFEAFASGELLSEQAIEATGDFTSEVATEMWVAVHSGQVSDYLGSLYQEVPDAFKEGITDVVYDPLPAREAQLLGEWQFQGNGDEGEVLGKITLYDNADEAPSTLFHEIGHHIAANHPGFYAEVSSLVSESPELRSQLAAHLNNYIPEKHEEEAFAEVISLFKTQPEILKRLSPEVFDSVSQWWTSAQARA